VELSIWYSRFHTVRGGVTVARHQINSK